MNALGYKPLRSVQSCKFPFEIWENLNERYAGRMVINQVIVLISLIRMKLTRGNDMGDHLVEKESHISRLSQMKLETTEPMQVALFLIYLFETPFYSSMVATWKYVTMRLIEEQGQ